MLTGLKSLGNKPRRGKIITCLVCGKEFYEKPSHVKGRKYCSRKCAWKSKKKEKAKLVCDYCKKDYFVVPCVIKWNNIRKHKHNFCSDKCKYSFSVGIKKVKDIMSTCPNCKKEFGLRPSKYRDRKKRYNKIFCSRKCFNGYYVGENSHLWKKDRSKVRGRALGDSKCYHWAKTIFKRDNYTCALCNQKGGDLEAHHIKRWADYPKLRFELENGITLCKKCHLAITAKEKSYIKHFQT